MLKQPKYFVSKSKAVSSTPMVATSPVEVPQTLEVVPTPRFPKVARVLAKAPRLAVFGLGAMTLASLLLLVGVNVGVVRASLIPSPLPLFFQKPAESGVVVSEAKSPLDQGLNFDIKTADARIEIIRAFLERYKSPLTPYDHYATELVASSDRYGLDYRLLPAIMMQESNLCKSSDPKLHNCLGFGIHERGTLGFDTYEEGFDRAARELKANYIDQGLTTPEQIMKKYTPSSNGSWANSVNQWIAEMEHNDREEGKIATDDANLLEYTSRK
jgi:hypothetical protein